MTLKKMQENPKVSIGMPVFNGEVFIRPAIESLLAQTFTDFELIISDNASSDGTEAICRELAATDSRIHYVRQKNNLGMFPNFKFTRDKARGEFFMWAAADDLKHPEFLRFSVAVLEDWPNVGLVYCGTVTRNLLTSAEIHSMSGFTTTNNKFLRSLFRLAHPTPNLIYGLFRRSILDKVEIKAFDYWDVYLGLWLELNTMIVVIPMNLYVITTNGERIPYSVNGKYINAKTYLKETSNLFKGHLGVVPAFFLNILNRYLIVKTTRTHNRMIKSTKI